MTKKKIELTDDERRIVAVSKVAASHEVESLVKIIERLIGYEIPEAGRG